MSPKVLSKSGDSLADVYDVVGSIAGIEELLSQEVQLVHGMGETIFSERLSGQMVALSSGALAQSLTWNVNFSFPEHSRVLAMAVVSNVAGRVDNAQVSILSGPAVDNMEVPVWAWDNAGQNLTCRVLIGGAVVTVNMLISEMIPVIPNLLVGQDAPRPASAISFRGGTTAFGAGTVETQVLFYLAFPQVAGLSSRGLPVPGW